MILLLSLLTACGGGEKTINGTYSANVSDNMTTTFIFGHDGTLGQSFEVKGLSGDMVFGVYTISSDGKTMNVMWQTGSSEKWTFEKTDNGIKINGSIYYGTGNLRTGSGLSDLFNFISNPFILSLVIGIPLGIVVVFIYFNRDNTKIMFIITYILAVFPYILSSIYNEGGLITLVSKIVFGIIAIFMFAKIVKQNPLILCLLTGIGIILDYVLRRAIMNQLRVDLQLDFPRGLWSAVNLISIIPITILFVVIYFKSRNKISGGKRT